MPNLASIIASLNRNKINKLKLCEYPSQGNPVYNKSNYKPHNDSGTGSSFPRIVPKSGNEISGTADKNKFVRAVNDIGNNLKGGRKKLCNCRDPFLCLLGGLCPQASCINA
uniref:Uncharacterized protein n=1 Tax=Octopus bimaculoides TaxID=37653 RepID=A0A0L8H1M9_OCTBM